MLNIRRSVEEYMSQYSTPKFDKTQPKVKLHEPTYGADEVMAALETLLTTRVTMGEKVLSFEKANCDYFKVPQAVVNNSGSSANLLAMAALSNPVYKNHLKAGDEVIVPALCWSTTLWPVVQMGLNPVIVDIDPKTLNVDPAQIEKAISPKTRAIVPVHVYGNPCDMTAIMDIAKRHNLIVMEDCCEALGAFYDGKSVGTFGEIGTFSFYFSHHITTLEGGVCITKDFETAELMRILRAHGWVREAQDKKAYTSQFPDIDPKFLFVNIGYNIRMTELQGAMGLIQFQKLNGFVKTRTQTAEIWRKQMAQWSEFFEFQQTTPKGFHSWFGFPMAVKESAPFSVRQFRTFLESRGIETRPLIAGNIAIQPAMKLFPHRVVGTLPHSNFYMKNGFTFGNHQSIDDNARTFVVDTIKEFVSSYMSVAK
ncbi:MAG: GDP-4-keto-6-deoxy-D-mannose 3-dehydratase [Elusimicrobia bacterium]|nr:GDP-4-keto-6-deoxy-D-mannose 3-dehydratase [Elusimicrobiota bacterium]